MNMMNSRMGRGALALAVCGTLLGASASQAFSLSGFEILSQSDVADDSLLSGAVDVIDITGGIEITIQNTSADAAGNGFGIVLSGFGFMLPDGVSITAISVALGGGSVIIDENGLPLIPPQDLNTRWGYANAPGSGHLNGSVGGTYGASVSSFHVDTDFSNAQIGKDYGVVSSSETTAPSGNNSPTVVDTVVVSLTLSGVDGSVASYIADNNVALVFGSPDSVVRRVPDAGSTLALVGMMLLAVRFFQSRQLRS